MQNFLYIGEKKKQKERHCWPESLGKPFALSLLASAMENGHRVTKEEVIAKLKDDGDFDRLRLKIIRRLKDNVSCPSLPSSPQYVGFPGSVDILDSKN